MKITPPPGILGVASITLANIAKTLKSVKYLPELSGVALADPSSC